MDDKPRPPILSLLQGAACTVIILLGVKVASPIIAPLLLALLLAYAVTPFPNWLMRRFKLSKSAAIAMTAVAAGALTLYLVLAVDLATVRIAAKLPVYEQRLVSLYEQIASFMSANGIVAPSLSVKSILTPDRLREITRVALPEAGVVISNGLLISLLGFLFVIQMAEQIGVKRGPLAESLVYYGSDARSYVTVTAKTAGINALINLAFLLVMGVDTRSFGVSCTSSLISSPLWAS
jgi:predicted PurR-regulated permease PerM